MHVMEMMYLCSLAFWTDKLFVLARLLDAVMIFLPHFTNLADGQGGLNNFEDFMKG